jgi:hypothetical protein
LARNQGVAAAIAFGFLAILLILSSLPRISNYCPVGLLKWGTEILSGTNTTYWPALVISLVIVAGCLLTACFYLERQEI